MPQFARAFVIFALALNNAQANAQAGATPVSASQTTTNEEQAGSQPSAAGGVCTTLEQAAAETELPVEFFVRIIWQESRFNALAVSRKGAQGIAQFMPRTADWRGLSNPFDVAAALQASARYLRDLRSRFGNLGLAAAAYNAGPQRVQDWLSGRAHLPKETRHYVKVVTGHSAEEWSGGAAQINLALEPMPCAGVAKSLTNRTAIRSDAGTDDASASSPQQSKPGWGVQLVGSPSQSSALASFQQLQRAYKGILQTRQPFVIQTRVGTSGFWYRVRVVTDSRNDADKLCSSLRAAGGSCLVQRN